ncbi:hcalcium-binding protein [Moritella sp. Urea-trap-13]|nr:hcalcium-binding protein [Moritella sp. Urea-trap-13]
MTVSLSGEQQGQDVKVTVSITQNVPLDHNGSSDGGYVTFDGDNIHINVPVQATDTDGDDLDAPANVDITITDGANPSFGTDSGVTINESTDENKVIEGQIPLNVGSDEIATIAFQSNQPSLAGITSNGQATTFTVVGNTLTVLDSADKPVMTVIIATDGSYKVTVTGPVDQKDASDKVNIDLNVTATDKDGDSTAGTLDITLTDGSNAAGGDEGVLTLAEGDLDVDGNGVGGTDTTYPASQSGSFVIQAGEDRLVPDSIVIDPALQATLIAELEAELTSGGEALTFSVDGDGNLVGTLPSGVVAVTVSLSGEQQGQDVKVTVSITQNVPLDHNGSSDGGYVTFDGDNIHINVPVQATDTDGDDLEAPANVDITITDGENPSFGTDSGVTINETDDKGETMSGQIPLNVGSDAIDSIVFQAAQPGLTGITSNGAATTFTVVDNILTVLDSAGDTVMIVTIATDGSYEVIVTGPVDQSDSELTNINLGVTATDNDGDSTDGTLAISLTDGSNAAGGDQGKLTLAEGDLDVDGNGVGGTDTTYPASQSGSFVIKAGEDSLVPSSVKIDPALQSNLIAELQDELTSGGEKLTFTVDGDGNLVGTLPNGVVAVTVSLSGEQQGQDVKVTVTITQNVPLDHTNTGDIGGYITSANDEIHINVPVQATDTDGDDLDAPANVDITITDGANPSFDTDSGVTINESTEKGNTISGQIPLDVGSDTIDSIVFQADQPELIDLTSNGLPTTYVVAGSTITVYDSASKPVMIVTVDTDGSYVVTVIGAIDQNGASDSINIDLAVTATDKDGDTSNGSMDITITDGDDAAGGGSSSIELAEGDLDTDGVGTSYPATNSGDFELIAGADRLIPDSVEVDPLQLSALMVELASELTSGGQALTFSLNADGDIVGRLNGQVALTVELSAAQNDQDLTVTVEITQNIPLDHYNSGDTLGYVTSENDEIHIKVPVQATDTDGDDLTNSVNVGIIIKDGEDPFFDTESVLAVNETSDKNVAVEGQLNLDVGSDAIATLVFAETQIDLADLTSNGNDTDYKVVDNTITLFDSNNQLIMVITVDTDGKYTVTVTGPIDQGDSLSTDLNLGVIATDKDGDPASGEMKISITDGLNGSGNETANVEITEPDLSPSGYPVSAETDITLKAGEDRLDVNTVGIDDTGTLIAELEAELTSGGEQLVFTLENGVLVGKLPNGDIAVSVTVTAVQAGQDVTVTVKVDQLLPLDHNELGNSTGYVSENGESIAINVPLQGKDTDGDSLDNPAVVTVTIKDGQLPSFGVDTGISLNEETQEGKVISSSIVVDTGSDEIASIVFDDANMQSGFENVTSNGLATAVEVSGQVLLLKDSDGKTVLEVTINNGGSYTAKITGELDQDINNLLNLPIKVLVTDDDGDTASGTINIRVTDGSDAKGGESGVISITEGDLDTSAGGTTYPVTGSETFAITAGEDRLDPTTVTFDPLQLSDLIDELKSDLTSGGQDLIFAVNAEGKLVGTTIPGNEIALIISLKGEQVGDTNVNATLEIEQRLPLDHDTTDISGFVTSFGDNISIKVPVQVTDSDGDSLEAPANVTISIADGEEPKFGLDDGTNIIETEASQTVQGEIDLDLGSDNIGSVDFLTTQSSLNDVKSNGQDTRYSVNDNVITVVIDGAPNDGQPVLTITMNKDGTYTVKQDKALEQDNNNGDSIKLELDVTATDYDGDTSNTGQLVINITDGLNPSFDTDLGVIINETSDKNDVIYGQIPLNVGSDAIDTIAFQSSQPSLTGITSNGAATTTVVSDSGRTLTVFDSSNAPVMTVTINTDGSYVVKVTGPVDQKDVSDLVKITLNVTATDKDGDTTNGSMNINITDGENAVGEQGNIDITEPDLSPDGYPIKGNTEIAITGGEDHLDVSTVGFDPNKIAALITELEAELTSGGEQVEFSNDVNGVLVGTVNGVEVITITLVAVQDGQNVNVAIEVIQSKPLDHNKSGNSSGLISIDDDSIAINLPIQGKDTDGDDLGDTANVIVTIKDGQLPSFGVDSGISLNEQDQEGKVISSSIVVDTGSDEIASIVFDDANMQSGFDGVTSNGLATTVEVNGQVLLLKDSEGKTVLEVTIGNDGNYTAKITGELDQGADNLLNLPIKVLVIDDDGDTARGTINIDVVDGSDATGGEGHAMTAVEGDLETPTGGTTYPKTTSDSFKVTAGEDRLDPTSVNIDSTQRNALIDELELELTSGGEKLDFVLSVDGSTLVGTTTGGDVAVTITLSGTQAGDDINVNVEFKQHLPLDHNKLTDSDGFVKVGDNTDEITIRIPVQAKDTDGDDLLTPAEVDITIQDGADPVFGLDSGTTITETENSQTVSGSIELDIGSDAIEKVEFEAVQASLDGLTTNGQATTYTVNGDVISVTIDGGTNNNDPVLTITMNNDGTYAVKQDEPLDQDSTKEDKIDLSLGVTATDKDGDVSNIGKIIISIKDGQDATGENVTANLTVVEGDLENPATDKAYPSTGAGSFTVEAVNDNLVANTMRIEDLVQTELLTELNSLTSNGAPLTFTLSVDAYDVITITGITQTGRTEILQITLTPTQETNGDVSVAMTIEQSGPLDHNNGSGDYVKVGDDAINVRIPVQMTDSDGDDLDKPVNVNVTITDGDDPKFGVDSTVNLEDGNNAGLVKGQIDVDTGSDEVVKVYFDNTQSSLNGLTSNGGETSYTVSADGSSIVVTLDSKPNVVVMNITVDIDGNYTVQQKQPIDQVDDQAGDNENIILNVLADDKDGDTSAPGHINIVVNDGTNAGGGQTGTITITEGDLTPEGIESPYPVIGSTTIKVDAGVDRLDPNSVEIDSSTIEALITELQNELTAGGEDIAFTYNENTGTLTGVAAGVVVMTVVVSAVQRANGDDVDITISIRQNQPLDHKDGNADGMVSTDGDKISIKVPVQVADTDGDKLDKGISVDVTINDGTDPVITGFESMSVNESALNGNNQNHQGSDPSSKDEKSKGKITVDSGSDEVTDFVIDVATFNQQNAGVLMSDGQQITLSYNSNNSNNGNYIGKVGNTTIFVITLSNSGEYKFILRGNVDHKEGGATDDELIITLPVQAIDQDGDKSNTVNVPVTIKDDEPTATDITLNMVEGSTSTLEDVLSIVGEGADDATVTALIVDGVRIPLDTLPKSGEYYQYEVKDGVTVLGILLITAEGETYFSANGDLDHAIEDITKLIDVEITDGDGDTDTSKITLEISDQDAKLTTQNSTGLEDNGSASDTIASNYHGITINMDINVGDLDRGEAVGNVTITAPTPAHGVFIYDDGNGTIITLAYTDGKVTIPAAAFELQADGVTYTLGGVTFLPDSDFSTIGSDFTIDGGKLTFDVSAEIVNSDGSTHPNMDGKFTISVDGVADIPTWDDANTTYHYTVTEDTDNVDLNLTAVLQDDDGSNTSSEDLYYFITIIAGDGTLVGDNLVETSIGSGIYKVAAADIGSVQVDPADNFSGDIKLDVYAQSEERDNHNTADSVHKEIIINVNPDADEATMKVKRIESDEDVLINLKDHILLTPQDDNTDNSESLFVRISGLPTGAILLLGGDIQNIVDGEDYYEVKYDAIDGLQLKPTPESNVDFTFTVEGVVKDTAPVTEPNGTTTEVVNEFVTGSQTIEVDLTGVADKPSFELDTSTWTPLPDDRIGLETTISEDGEAKFDFGVISGEIAKIPDGITDTSETLSLVISNIPEGVKIFDANGNVQALVYVGTDDNGNPRYEVKLSTLNGITITPPLHSTLDIDLAVRLVVTENDGDSKSFDGNLVVHVLPVIDAPLTYTTESTGLEDGLIELNWKPELTDSKEMIIGLEFADVPDGYYLLIGTKQFIPVDGKITFSNDPTFDPAESIYLKAPKDSDVDFILKTKITVIEDDVDSSADAKETEIVGILNVNIDAVVEDDGILAIVETDVDGVVTYTNSITSDANGVIDINVNTTGDQTFTGGLSFIEDDLSSNEVIEKVIITFVDADGNTITDQAVLDQFFVAGGINNGDGSWTVPKSELGNLKITATEDQVSTVYVKVSAEIRDLGDNSESDSSNTVIKDANIELEFIGSSGSTLLAGNIDVDNDVIIIGTEDTRLNFGDQLDAFISVNITDSVNHDVFTLVISADDLPAGASITGTEYNYETGEYVFNVTVGPDGKVDLSAVGMSLPKDFAGDFELDVKYVTTDTVSGDVKEVTDTIPVQVTPVVDIPGNSQTGDNTPEIKISVVKTSGLDTDKQPITDGSTDQEYEKVAYEDGDITLDLSVVLADSSTSLNEGLETVTSVTLTVDAAQGFFVATDGSLVSEITLPASELGNIQFRPVEDFSGSVSVGVKVDITDTADFDKIGGSATDTGSYTTDVNFEVVAVNDAVNWTGTDKVVIGQEDAGGVSLVGIGGSIVDVDGSEQILSMKLTGVPDGFTIEGAANNSNGEWSISLPSGQTTFNLDNIKVIPPENFSGKVELNVVVYSKEDSLTEVVEHSTSITIDVQPVADRVDTDVETEASGTENDTAGIDLILNVEAFDDEDSYDGSDANVTEKGPEGLQITLSNVPDSSSITLPDGVAGSVTNMGGGIWVVTVESSDIDKLIFHPGDANSANWDGNINVDIRAVDNGVVAEDSIAIDKTIHIEVEAENDAPVNVLPSDLTADEDVPLLITSLKVVDVDVNETVGSKMTVTLNVGNGTINVPDSFDWAALGLTVTGEGSKELIITGSLDDINALLASGVEYTGDTNFNGDDTLVMTTNDQANSGTGPAEGLTDTDSITITVNPVNDAPVNTVPDSVTAVEDYNGTVITGMQISDVDVDVGETGSTNAMSVTLSVVNGILSVVIPDGSSVTVTGQGTDSVIITGSMDDINALLNNGVTYEGDDNYSGVDELTMTTYDGGNVGSGNEHTATSKVPVTVTPKADAPTLSLDNSFIQTAAIRGSLGTMIPLLGLIAALTDTDGSETLSIMVKNLAGGQLVNSNGDVIAGNQNDGSWIITKEDFSDLNVIGLPEGENNLEVVAVSEETYGSKAESTPVDINIVVDNLANTGNQIGGSSNSDAANLVIDSSAEATLLGGAGNDILIGGTASDILIGGAGDDILWGGIQNGSGDGVKDTFVWQTGDFGTAGNAATDNIMDFEVAFDTIDLTNAFSSYDAMSLSDLSSLIKLTGNGADSTLEIYDDQGGLVQNIVLNGVAESVLLGNDPAGMSNEDKLGALLNSGQLDVADNFGNGDSNSLNAGDSGESLYGFDGSDTLIGGDGADILSGGEGDDILTGGNGRDLFTWEDSTSGIDTITDFTLDEDQLDLSQILSDGDDDKFTMEDLLAHKDSGDLAASFDADGNVNLTVKTEENQEQNIVLHHIDSASFGGVSEADILNQLFSHDAFKVDPNS